MTLQEQIAVSIEEVNKLLTSNAKLSIAYLGTRLNQIQDEQNKVNDLIRKELASIRLEMASIDKRFKKAGEMFKDLQNDIETLRQSVPKESGDA